MKNSIKPEEQIVDLIKKITIYMKARLVLSLME